MKPLGTLLGLLLIAVVVLQGPSAAADTPWRSYEVYRPEISSRTIWPQRSHDATITKFGDTWFALFDDGHEEEGQRIRQQTAPAPMAAWSAPIEPFSTDKGAKNPIMRLKEMWQPALILHEKNGRQVLTALWTGDRKLFLSELENPFLFDQNPSNDAQGAKWRTRKLFGRKEPFEYRFPVFDGVPWRMFAGNNGIQLKYGPLAGRLLFPVTLIQQGAKVSSRFFIPKRDSVIYSDDNGVTWKVSPGRGFHDTRSWEATIWETRDGRVHMISRANRKPGIDVPDVPLKPTENLKYSYSNDGGSTWAPHELMNMEVALSRPHVLTYGSRNVKVQNDWYEAGDHLTNRRNLALFFSRGNHARNFVAGVNLTDNSDFMDYPQMAIDGDQVTVIYTRPSRPQKRRQTVVTQLRLPAPDRYYIFPRKGYGTLDGPAVDGRRTLRFEEDWESAAIDIDEAVPGRDYLWLRLRFKPESSALLTLVNVNNEVKLFAKDGQVWLGKNNPEQSLGQAAPWSEVTLVTGANGSWARIGEGSWVATGNGVTQFRPYLGRGYHYDRKADRGDAFLLDIGSLATRVSSSHP